MAEVFNQIDIKSGNLKLGNDTAIINMGPAAYCSSKLKGMCPVVNRGMICYAEKAEKMYSSVRKYRMRQWNYWSYTPANKIISDIYQYITKKKGIIKYLRFNESGDFHCQKDVDKLSEIGDSLSIRGITTYGYTARSDLCYSNIKFLLKGSGFTAPNGTTIVKRKSDPVPDIFPIYICKMNCRTCKICKSDNQINVVFNYH